MIRSQLAANQVFCGPRLGYVIRKYEEMQSLRINDSGVKITCVALLVATPAVSR